jgi:hypothetical protein
MSETLAQELARRADILWLRLRKINRTVWIGRVAICDYYPDLTIWVDRKRAFRRESNNRSRIINRNKCYEALRIMRTMMVLDDLADVADATPDASPSSSPDRLADV